MISSVMLLLVLFPYTLGNAHVDKCRDWDPHPVIHEYHQSGDIIIGGVASQAFIIADPITFTEPPTAVPDDLLYEAKSSSFGCMHGWVS